MPHCPLSIRTVGTLRIGLAVLFVLEVPGCMTRDARPAQYAELLHRASFDLQCKEAEIALTPLQEISGASCTTEFHGAKSAGVTCHGQRATYVLHQTDSSGNAGWFMNNESLPQK